MSSSTELVRIGITGERSRRAQEILGGTSPALVLALRRELPFLTRKRIAVVAAPPRTTLYGDVELAVPNIVFTTTFSTGAVGAAPSRSPSARGALFFDSTALARVLDGVLGGGEPDVAPIAPGAVSAAQSALAGRVAAGILRAFVDVFRARLGLGLEQTASAPPTDTGACVVLSFSIADGGTIGLAVPIAGLHDGDEPSDTADDGRIAAVLVDVEVDVVAELGKVRMPLQALASLRVGDLLQLTLPLEERARVCAGGAVLFHGRPTASGLAIGIVIERHAT